MQRLKKKIKLKEKIQQEQNVLQHFIKMAEQKPNLTAIVEKDHAISFGQLKKEVLTKAKYFKSKGIRKGDRVLVFVPVSLDLYRSVLALFHIGAVAVFLDEWSSVDRLKQACMIAGCRGFIAGWKARAMGLLIKPIRKIPIWLSPKTQSSFSSKLELERMTGNETALITFTTGSTGAPKAANRTHKFLNAQLKALTEKIESNIGDVGMPALPIFVLLNLANGNTSILPDFNPRKPNEMDPKKIIDQIKKYKVQRVISSPFFVKSIAHSLNISKTNLPFLKKVFTGGAPVFPNEAIEMKRGFGGNVSLNIVYGSTEAEPISGISENELAYSSISKGLPVGEIFHRTQLKIIKNVDACIGGKELKNFELNHGEIGEIIVAGEHVLDSYFRNEEALKRNKIFTKEEVWHRTGDAGYLDEQGKLFLVGRCAQIIHHNGHQYSPFLYEYLLQQIKGVNIGTVLHIDNQLIIVLEADIKINKQDVYSLFPNEDIEIKFLHAIPRDARHFTKIEYGKLKDLLQNL